MKALNKCYKTIFVSLLFPVSAIAGGGNGHVEIEHVGGYGNGRLVFFYTTNHLNPPACNTYKRRWVMDLGNPAGKEQYALLLSAQISGKQVTVYGTNQCDLAGDSETVYWVGYPVDHSTKP
ncbi:hypothetical protein [Methylocaldum gracile]|jgi:hypothetical protein|uniref:hypothetical protein n=1 Tax=unclassified Methylocaldum TaxID=2622260 RepID=UPI003DA1A355